MQEIYIAKIPQNREVIGYLQDFMKKHSIKLAFPVFAYGKIKNFELLSLSGSLRVVSDYSGKGFEINAISGKLHQQEKGFYSNIAVILNRSYSTTLHGILRRAQAATKLEIGLRKINLDNIIEV